jgi:hypothetical protein
MRAKFIYEKYTEKSDPVADMKIGQIDLEKIYRETVIDGLNRWYQFFNDLELIGKKVTFNKLPMKNEVTIIIKLIKYGEIPYEVYFYDQKYEKYIVDVKGKLIIHQ